MRAARHRLWALCVLACVPLLAARLVAQSQPTVRATVDRNEVSLDEQIRLQVQIEGAAARPVLPPLQGFRVISGGQSQQMSFVNGRTSVSYVFEYFLIPERTGRFQVGPVAIEVDGKRYQSRPFTVNVVAASQKPASQQRDFFLTAKVSNPKPYVGEQILYTWRFYRVANAQVGDARLTSLDFASLQSEELGDVNEYPTTLEGVRYSVSELRRALFASRAGKVEIPPSELQLQVAVDTGARRRSFFDFDRVTMQPRVLHTTPVTVEVQPLPPAPADFSGLVGDFRIKAEMGKSSMAVGESATLSVTISGMGNVHLISPPKLPELPAFKTYQDRPSSTINRTADGLRGQSVYRTALVPLQSGRLQIPEMRLVFFDPERETYRTSQTQPIDLDVRPGEGEEELMLTESVAPTTGKVAVKILADDILPIRRSLDSVEPPPLAGWRGMLWLAVGGAPPLLFLGLVGFGRWSRARRDQSPERRRATAMRRANDALARVESLPQGTDTKTVARAASLCLRGFVADKLGAGSAGTLTPADVESLLGNNGSDVATARRARELLERLEATQFARGTTAQNRVERTTLCRSLTSLLKVLDAQLNGRRS